MNKPTLKEQAHGEIERIFRILLPQNGLAVREEQITLCHAIWTPCSKTISLYATRVSGLEKLMPT